MFSSLKTTYYKMGVALTSGMMLLGSTDASAGTPAATGNSVNSIAKSLTDNISDLPGLLTALSYLVGLVFGVLGVLKIKDHVEQPSQTPLKEGAIRLAAGGALFALPIIFEAMQNAIGTGTGNAPTAASLNKIQFNVQ